MTEDLDNHASNTKEGSFYVIIDTIKVESNSTDNDENNEGQEHSMYRTIWGCIEILDLNGSNISNAWFSPENDNCKTSLIEIPLFSTLKVEKESILSLKYHQASQRIVLSQENLEYLLNGYIQITIYHENDKIESKQVPLLQAILTSELVSSMVFTYSIDGDIAYFAKLHVPVKIQMDANIADFVEGSRVIHLSSVSLHNLPHEWIFPDCDSNEKALEMCASDKNISLYTFEINLPDFRVDSEYARYKFSNGKLWYERLDNSDIVNENDSSEKVSGIWKVVFSTTSLSKLYLKDDIEKLIEYINVNHGVKGIVCRVTPGTQAKAITPDEILHCTLALCLEDLLVPGKCVLNYRENLREAKTTDMETLERDLAAATNNEEKKKLQAIIADYDNIVQRATSISGSMKGAQTFVQLDLSVKNAPLIVPLPAPIAPTRSIDELIPTRNIVEEVESERNALSELRLELTSVIQLLIQEYEEFNYTSTALSESEKKQKLIFRLNVQGTYHKFKERLKKRVIRVIQEKFTKSGFLGKTSGEDDNEKSPANKQTKKEYSAKLYDLMMGEVHTVLHTIFYEENTQPNTLANTGSEQINLNISVIETLGIKAVENEVIGDLEKAEMFHLDRTSCVEDLMHANPENDTYRKYLIDVWYDYGKFCLTQGLIEKAGSCILHCLEVDSSATIPLLAYSALLCELKDLSRADDIIKNTVKITLANNQSKDADVVSNLQAACAHALLAFHYSQSNNDSMGNSMQYELYHARNVIQQVRQEPVSLSSVWILLAEHAHDLNLHRLTDQCLVSAKDTQKPRDIITKEDRITQRIINAEVLHSQGNLQLAIESIKEALSIDPTNPLAWFIHGKISLNNENESAKAVDCFQRALERKLELNRDKRLGLYLIFGVLLLQVSKYDTAKELFLIACEEFQLSSNWLGIGISCLRMNDLEGCRLSLSEANKLDATNAEVWGYLALLALIENGDKYNEYAFTSIHQYLEQALRYKITNATLLREISTHFVAVDLLDDAEKLLRRSLVLQESSMTRKIIADVLASKNLAEKSFSECKIALNQDSHDIKLKIELLNKCETLLKTLGRSDEAVEYQNMLNELKTQQFR